MSENLSQYFIFNNCHYQAWKSIFSVWLVSACTERVGVWGNLLILNPLLLLKQSKTMRGAAVHAKGLAGWGDADQRVQPFRIVSSVSVLNVANSWQKLLDMSRSGIIYLSTRGYTVRQRKHLKLLLSWPFCCLSGKYAKLLFFPGRSCSKDTSFTHVDYHNLVNSV